MHVAGLYSTRLFPGDFSRQQIVRLAALLHDVAHGPFGHQYDDTVYRRLYRNTPHGHDHHRERIVKRTEIRDRLGSYSADEIIKAWDSASIEDCIIHGVLGADKMDYLLRDSYFAGVPQFGRVAKERLINLCSRTRHAGREVLCYPQKAFDDIVVASLARFLMYRNVYFHKTPRAADILLRQILEESINHLRLVERTRDLDEFQRLDDYSLIGELRALSKGGGRVTRLSRLANRLFRRQLYKMVHQHVIESMRDLIEAHPGTREEELIKRLAEDCIAGIRKEIRTKSRIELYWDTPYRLSVCNPEEFTEQGIFIRDPKSRPPIITLKDMFLRTKWARGLAIAHPYEDQSFRVFRVYTTAESRRVVDTAVSRWKRRNSTREAESAISF